VENPHNLSSPMLSFYIIIPELPKPGAILSKMYGISIHNYTLYLVFYFLRHLQSATSFLSSLDALTLLTNTGQLFCIMSQLGVG
jgi:hypothetical protein